MWEIFFYILLILGLIFFFVGLKAKDRNIFFVGAGMLFVLGLLLFVEGVDLVIGVNPDTGAYLYQNVNASSDFSVNLVAWLATVGGLIGFAWLLIIHFWRYE